VITFISVICASLLWMDSKIKNNVKSKENTVWNGIPEKYKWGLAVSLNSRFGNPSRYHSSRNADLEHLEGMSQNRIVTVLQHEAKGRWCQGRHTSFFYPRDGSSTFLRNRTTRHHIITRKEIMGSGVDEALHWVICLQLQLHSLWKSVFQGMPPD
jgi:hypothetical protein